MRHSFDSEKIIERGQRAPATSICGSYSPEYVSEGGPERDDAADVEPEADGCMSLGHEYASNRDHGSSPAHRADAGPPGCPSVERRVAIRRPPRIADLSSWLAGASR
jgi:hypothetical protein